MALKRAAGALLPRMGAMLGGAGASSSAGACWAAPAAYTALASHSPTGLQKPGTGATALMPLAGPCFYSTQLMDPLSGSKGGVSVCDELSRTPTHHISYDEHSHKRLPPSEGDHRTFAYFVVAGGRFVYASAARLLVLKLLMSLSAAADVLAMATLEVDLSGINEGETVTVKWRGKPVFIRHRTDEEIDQSNAVSLSDLRDPEEDAARALNPKYLIVVGICTHLGCVPIAGAGDYNGWFCPCHGSHYDISGRVRKGPAPYNLEVPDYKYLEDQKVVVG